MVIKMKTPIVVAMEMSTTQLISSALTFCPNVINSDMYTHARAFAHIGSDLNVQTTISTHGKRNTHTLTHTHT